jgi:3-dehydroquinate dehydratase/shikimate dehydrogenase
MLCVSIAQESRRLALADMVNAARQCDLLEMRLDRFVQAPDVNELLTHKPKPIILSCRRKKEGGDWPGTESERLALLRTCVFSKADYVEIELDASDEIRVRPPTKRVISYISLSETPHNIAEIYAKAQTKNPDVIKLVTLARTPEEAWPLLQILAKPAVPTVVVGLGKPGVMLTVFGRKIGAPWTYAALEKGMEVYPGQPTVGDLREVYHYDSIDKGTRLVGVTGFSEREYVSVAVLNAGFAHLGLPVRCLPLGVGSIPLFRKIMDAVKLVAVCVDEEHRAAVLGIAAQSDQEAQQARSADLLLSKAKGWQAHNTLGKAAVAALETALKTKTPSDTPLKGRIVLIAGVGPSARSVAAGIKERGGVLIVASHNKESAHQLAQALECRAVQFEALYTTMHDVLIACPEETPHAKPKAKTVGGRPGPETGDSGIHAGYLKSGMTVMDLSGTGWTSSLQQEAAKRGCLVVESWQVLREQLAEQLRLITGKGVPQNVLDDKFKGMLEDRM